MFHELFLLIALEEVFHFGAGLSAERAAARTALVVIAVCLRRSFDLIISF
jgi:hypothetical protein